MSALQKNNPNKRSDHGDGYSRNPYETEEDDRRDLPAIFKKERHPRAARVFRIRELRHSMD